MRLRRVDVNKPGYGRRRRGRGVSFLDTDGRPLRDPDELARCRDLVIPPAWRQVWICPHPAGHIQATGVDAAGRKQYLYHPQWRARRDAAKFDHLLEVAHRLPELRERTGADLRRRGLDRERVLATVACLLDLGMFRVGSDQYATGDDPTFGVATLRRTMSVPAGAAWSSPFRPRAGSSRFAGSAIRGSARCSAGCAGGAATPSGSSASGTAGTGVTCAATTSTTICARRAAAR